MQNSQYKTYWQKVQNQFAQEYKHTMKQVGRKENVPILESVYEDPKIQAVYDEIMAVFKDMRARQKEYAKLEKEFNYKAEIIVGNMIEV